MSYRLIIPITVDQSGLTWSAQLIDCNGADVGGPIIAGFSACGDNYVWDYDLVPDSLTSGTIVFTSDTGLVLESQVFSPSPEAEEGPYRITASDIQGIIDFTPSITNLTPFIEAAEELVTEMAKTSCGKDYTGERLEIIETWLAAHFLAIRDPRYQSESMGAASYSTTQVQTSMNLSLTPYGQQAMLLDTCGWLAWLDKHIAQGKRGKAGILWLGKDKRCETNFPWRYLGLNV